MPIVRIEGVPSNISQFCLELIEDKIKEIISSIPELGLEKSEISVYFPKDYLETRPDAEIIATVDGLFQKPERTDEVRQDLASKVAATLFKIFEYSGPLVVECFVNQFDPKKGFARLSSGVDKQK